VSIQILEEKDCGRAVLICTPGPDFAFGPVFRSADEAAAFLEWLPLDPRDCSEDTLARKLDQFRERPTRPCPGCGDEIDADAERCEMCDRIGAENDT